MGSFDTLGAIAVNYDGKNPGDEMVAFAGTVRVGSTAYDGTDGNNQTDRVWHVAACLGDMNGDRSVNGSDGTTSDGAYELGRDNATSYNSTYPGLEGSRVYHGDCDQRGVFDSGDDDEFTSLVSGTCCTPKQAIGDADIDFDVDLDDLLLVLGNFGDLTPPSAGDGDFDGDTDLDDLLLTLGNFNTDDCPGILLLHGGGWVALSIEPWDSNYTGGGFLGEDEHFCFDSFIEIADPNDDWLLTGMCATAANGAEFRLIEDPNHPLTPGNTEPEKYTTFFSVPKGVNASSRFTNPLQDGGVAGGCNPAHPEYIYDTTEIDAAWFDTPGNSSDGPAAVFRIVIDVSGVTGADTSGGLGSVYFSDSGPSDPGHIEVAHLHTKTGRKFAGTEVEELEGEFYVMD